MNDPPPAHLDDPPAQGRSLDWERVRDLPPRMLAGKILWRCRKSLARSPLNRRCSPGQIENLFDPSPRSPSFSSREDFSPQTLRPAPILFLDQDERLDAASTARRLEPRAVDAMIADAETLMERRFHFLGFPEIRFSDTIRWTGHDLSELDVYLNRMDFLIPLSLAAVYTGRAEFLLEARKLLREWLHRPNAASATRKEKPIEIAIRIINWAFFLQLSTPLASLEDEDRELAIGLARATEAQLRLIENGLSPGANHLLLEALGLRIAGAAFPNLPGARRRERLGMGLLDREISGQVHPDGVHKEQSTGYHLNVATYFLKDLLIRRRRGQTASGEHWNRVGKMIRFAAQMNKPDGTIPMFGDLDGFRTRYREHLETRILYPAGLTLFPETGINYDSSLGTDLDVWFLGPTLAERARTLNEPRNRVRIPRSEEFPHGGVCVLRGRDGTTGAESGTVAYFDRGPFGMEEHPHHGHADCLSFELCFHGETALMDPGGFGYPRNSFRQAFRSTAVHNTIRIDDLDQTPVADRFQVGPMAPLLQPRSFVSTTDFAAALGSHGGYRRLRSPVTHTRALCIAHHPPYYAVVWDLLTGTGRHQVDQIFQCPPLAKPVVQTEEGVTYTLDQGTRVEILTPTPAPSGEPETSWTVECGQSDPVRGWVSPIKGGLKAAPLITRRGFFTLPRLLTAVLVAFPRGSQRETSRPKIERMLREAGSGVFETTVVVRAERFVDRWTWSLPTSCSSSPSDTAVPIRFSRERR